MRMDCGMEYKTSTKNSDQIIDVEMTIFKAIKGYRLMSSDAEELEMLINRLNLEPFLDFLRDFNKSNDLPYHNFYHACCVFLNCYEGAWCEQLSDDETRGLCAGALLHDFDHTGGLLIDEDNVKIALIGLNNAQKYATSKGLGLTDVQFEIAKSVIQCSTYQGGKFLSEPTTIPQMIFRDSDLMQPYEEDDIALLIQFTGLKEEVELARQTTFTLHDFARGVKRFQDTETVWYTEWANDKARVRDWEFAKSRLLNVMSNVEPINDQ